MESTLPFFIHTDQTRFIKKRYVGEYIRLIWDLLEQTKIEKSSGILLSIDIRKGFDTLKWPIIHKALETYNFGESLRRSLKFSIRILKAQFLIMATPQSGLNLLGVEARMPARSVPVCVNCGAYVRQIRQSDIVKGVSLCGNEIKISQFADDTNLICADIPSVENVLQILVDFGKISGLILNKEKTKARKLRSANNKDKPLGLKWVSCGTKFLRVHLS